MSLSILGHQADAGTNGCPRRPGRDRPSVEEDLAGFKGVRPGNHPGQLRPPGTEQSGDADNLAAVHGQARIAQPAVRRVLDAQQLGAAHPGRRRKVLGQLAVDHQSHQIRDRRGQSERRDPPSVTHDGGAAADPRRLPRVGARCR